jgi:hypothetical protein
LDGKSVLVQLNCSKGGPRTCWCCRLSARYSLHLHNRSFNKAPEEETDMARMIKKRMIKKRIIW